MLTFEDIINSIYSHEWLAAEDCEGWLYQNNAFLKMLFENEKEEMLSYDQKDPSMAILNFNGIVGLNITNEAVEESLDKIESNPGVKRIMMKVNSPGGGAYESQAIDETLKNFKEKNKIPMTAYVGSTAASAGYMLAARADNIIASKAASKIGSIGTIAKVMDYSKQREKDGIKMLVFKSGKYKDFPSEGSALTEEDKEKIQSKVNKAAEDFFSRVASCRGKYSSTIRAMEGETFTADEALKRGLIDQIGNAKSAEKMLKNMKCPYMNLENSEYNLQGIENESVILKNSQTLNTDKNVMENELKHDTNREQAALINSLQSQVEIVKKDLIEEFQVLYQKASGNSCPASKINMLQNATIDGIKAEIEYLKPLIENRYQVKEVKDSTLGSGEVAKDIPLVSNSIQENKENSLRFFSYAVNSSAKLKPDFNLNIAREELLMELGKGGMIDVN